MNKQDCNNAIAKQAFLSDKVIAHVLAGIKAAGEKGELPVAEAASAKRIIIVGCGDSYCSALAAKAAFESVAKITTDVMRIVDFTRHFGGKQFGEKPEDTLVIGVSVSGKVSRVVEAMQRASYYGAKTLMITGNPESPAGKAAKYHYPVNLIKEYCFIPGANSYCATMVAMFSLALKIAKHNGTVTDAEYADMNLAITDYVAAFAAKLEEFDDHAFHVAQRWHELRCFDYIGDYADYATAFFGSAKILETFGGYTTYDDSEDWNHINYFLRHPETIGRLVVANSDTPSYGRLKETARTINNLGSPCVILTDGDKSEYPEGYDVFSCPKPRYFWLAPLMQHFVFGMIAGYIANHKGFGPADTTCHGVEKFYSPVTDDDPRILGSEIVIK